MSICSPSVTKKSAGRLNGRAGSEPEVSEETLDLTVIDRVQDYLKQISDITSKVPDQVSYIIVSLYLSFLVLGSEVSDNNLPDNKQLHDDSSGVRGQPDQGGPGQDQGSVPHDQHGSGAAHQGYRGADQGGQEGRRISILINNLVSSCTFCLGPGSS